MMADQMPVRDSCGNDTENWLDSKYFLTVELTELLDRLDLGYGRKVTDDSKVFVLNHLRGGVTSSGLWEKQIVFSKMPYHAM